MYVRKFVIYIICMFNGPTGLLYTYTICIMNVTYVCIYVPMLLCVFVHVYVRLVTCLYVFIYMWTFVRFVSAF